MKATTTVKQEWYPNGQVKEEAIYNGTQLANGWSFKTYYPNGALQQEQCFSHGQLIEQKVYDEQGQKTAHTFWNQRLKQMVERPVVTHTIRPNIVTGCLTVYSIKEILPLIAELIEAPDQSAELLAAHNLYYGYSSDEEENDETERSDEDEIWNLKGRKGSLGVVFERHEGFLFYHIHTPDIADYEKARQLKERAQKRNSLHRYYEEGQLQKRSIDKVKPIVYYIKPSPNPNWLEFELNTWGTEPVYTLLDKDYFLSIHYVKKDSKEMPKAIDFLSALPNWENLAREVKQTDTVFYIIQQKNTNAIPIIRNPSPAELEHFLKKHRQI